MLVKPRKTDKGFTLIELIIVIFIVGILAAIAAPSFLGMASRRRVDDALSATRASLQEIQREAIRRSTTCTLGFGTNINQLRLSSNCFVSSDNAIKITAAATSTDTTISVNALPFRIYSGTRLVFSSGTVARVTASASPGASSLSVTLSGAIASGELAPIRNLSEQVNMDQNLNNDIVSFSFRGMTNLTNSGTIVFYPTNATNPKKCLVISSPLGLIRSGNYTGSAGTTNANLCSVTR